MMRNGKCYRLRPLVRRTSASGSSWLPTPTAGEHTQNRSASPNASIRPTLIGMARRGFWPTPRARETGDYQQENGRRKLTLTGAAKRWPTPNATDGEKAPKTFVGGNPSLPMAVTLAERYPTPTASDATGGPAYSKPPSLEGGFLLREITPGPLNPTWVEWLLGFPPGWTDLEDLETP